MEQNQNVLVIGGGPSGLLASLIIAEKYPVTLLERKSRHFTLGKRILVSGNGRANFFNEDLLSLKGSKEVLLYLKDTCHFAYRKEGKLYYPFFNRSECLLNALEEQMKKLPIRVLEADAISLDPKRKTVQAESEEGERTLSYDVLVLALGGMSYDRVKDNISFLKPLALRERPFAPALCPIRTKERIPSYLKNQRLRGRLALLASGEEVFSEEGEVLFKEDGLSGICVFDSTLRIHEIQRKDPKAFFTYTLDYTQYKGEKEEMASTEGFPLFLRKYLKERALKPNEKLSFSFDSFYPLKDAQISDGGISLSEILPSGALKKRKDIYLVGEMLDRSYPCGGYNMGKSLIEGYLAGKDIIRKN